MQRNDIACHQQFREIDIRDIMPGRPFRCRHWIIRDNFRIKGANNLRRDLTNSTGADNANRLSIQVEPDKT